MKVMARAAYLRPRKPSVPNNDQAADRHAVVIPKPGPCADAVQHGLLIRLTRHFREGER